MHASEFSQHDLTDLEHYENVTEVHLSWSDDLSVEEVLPMLKRCTEKFNEFLFKKLNALHGCRNH